MSASISLTGSLLQTLSERGGIDPGQLTPRLGSDRRDLRRPLGVRGPSPWLEERAFEVTGDAALGLHLGERGEGRGFGIVGQLAASSRTLRDCIEVALTYYALILEGQR